MFDFPLVTHPNDIRDAYLDALFNEQGDEHDADDLALRAGALSGLADLFVNQSAGRYDFCDLHFDGYALRAMLGRFQRDAFGVGRLMRCLDEHTKKGQLEEGICNSLKDAILGLGLRVNTLNPSKTRIAAVFSLWMCAFRPICLQYKGEDVNAVKFCANLNFWITRVYLMRYGEVLVGAHFREHFQRVLHDFTYRDVNLSSLEMLYCGIFRPR